MTTVQLFWKSSTDSPNKVVVTGSFDNWSQSVEAQKSVNGDFVAEIKNVNVGDKLTFKFVVDGSWVTGDYPTETDEQGNVNNVHVVVATPVSSVENKKEKQEVKQEVVLTTAETAVVPLTITENKSKITDDVVVVETVVAPVASPVAVKEESTSTLQNASSTATIANTETTTSTSEPEKLKKYKALKMKRKPSMIWSKVKKIFSKN